MTQLKNLFGGRARKSDIALSVLALCLVALLLTLADGVSRSERAGAALEEKKSLVGSLQLTDLCLFTEARYTRHPSQADLQTPFQDHPLSFDHFPSGSLIRPPAMIAEYYARMDRKTKIPD